MRNQGVTPYAKPRSHFILKNQIYAKNYFYIKKADPYQKVILIRLEKSKNGPPISI